MNKRLDDLERRLTPPEDSYIPVVFVDDDGNVWGTSEKPEAGALAVGFIDYRAGLSDLRIVGKVKPPKGGKR